MTGGPFISEADQARAVDLVDAIQEAIDDYFEPDAVDLAIAIRSTIVVLSFLGKDGDVDPDIFIAEVGAVMRAILTQQEAPDGSSSPH